MGRPGGRPRKPPTPGFGTVVREALDRLGYKNASDAADYLGVATSTLRDWEQGRSFPDSPESLYAVGRLLVYAWGVPGTVVMILPPELIDLHRTGGSVQIDGDG